MKPKLAIAAVCLLTSLTYAQHEASKYKPATIPNGESILGVQFLPPERDWERMDIYTPKTTDGKKLPCIVYFYGGGYGGKVVWNKAHFQVLVDNGYVVAMPDYVLGAQQPVPLTVWDAAAAIRFLRANAQKYSIDPERIGVLGISAGGWIAQNLATTDSRSLVAIGNDRRGEVQRFVPMIEPHAANSDFSAQVCAVVTDWGAGTITGLAKQGYIGPNDPPLFTVGPAVDGFVPKGVQAYRDAGAIAELAVIYEKDRDGKPITDVKNPHDFGHTAAGVVEGKPFTRDADGKEISLATRTLQFLDTYVKNPQQASAPEILPAGGAVLPDTPVTLRTVHASGAIHYTLDGSAPSEKSPRYTTPLKIRPGTTLKALTIKPGLKPSAITTVTFTEAQDEAPVITTAQTVYRVKAGEAFSLKLEAKSAKPVTWALTGKILAKPLEAIDTNRDNSNMKREEPWLKLDPQSGVLSGTATTKGVNVFIITAHIGKAADTQLDARQFIVIVE